MPIVQQFQQLGYKSEAVELTAEALTSANYDTVWNECVVDSDAAINERRPRRATMAPIAPIGGAFTGVFTGTFEPRPSGTDNTAPDWYDLLKASGASVTGDVATWGAEVSTSGVLGTSCTVKHRDGAFEKVLAGMRCGLRFYAEKGSLWLCDVDGRGRYSQSAQTSYIAGAHPSAGAGQPFLGLTHTIGAFTGSIAAAELAIENTVTPEENGAHASGFGGNYITTQKLMYRPTVAVDATDWRAGYLAGTTYAISFPMSAGAAGNVLTWTGTACLVEDPGPVEYRDGLGYRPLVFELIQTAGTAALTLTQS